MAQIENYPAGHSIPPQYAARPTQTDREVVYIIDACAEAEILRAWLAAADIEVQTCSRRALTDVEHAGRAGCLIVDAHSIPPSCLPGYPIIMIAEYADIGTAVRALKGGALDFVEKPLREHEIVAAVLGAIDYDRQRRSIASRHAEWRARFATLSPRERQVMALVTAGQLNKQVAGHLGLSEITVKAHRGAAMRKMAARTLADLVRMADALEDAASVPPRNGFSPQVRTGAGGDRHIGCSLPLPAT
jgi:FixJ family two-component response regulator